MRHMVVLKRQVGNIEAQDGIMIAYDARHHAKLRTEKSVLSKEGAKGEQKGCKEGAKRCKEVLGLGHVGVRWGERGPMLR